ncbi:aminotransferase class III-fold pyridoxal phosphate-dependent enzyme [Actinospica durhamensis]|uniref:Aminotransferase class III-fold pyridoxal phosphate-dependent enzyme n=1 Tax=Actinospica durhamensis TaxID=1508375 RepID=A0A941ESJ0_9ACTN|nr:aminotransferase class III-fold pyridoxal phosphate-dependent enzyme [Actinospica durhamensis]MBR7836740.1 aminotransferase class III-fold pyridoxal phosphate-dependent enzyme [Actinospica durhamensis]
MSAYGISSYPDVPAIEARIRNLTGSPIRTLTAEQLAAYHEWYEKHTPTSKQAAAEANEYIPGGVQHNLALNDPWALSITRAEGAYLHDADGNRYIDFLQAGGPTVLGSNHEAVRAAVLELLEHCGPVTGMLHPSETALAKLIHDFMPAVHKFRMLGSGTEAVMAAIRVARAHTGKQHIIKVGGAYHGWSDQVVFGLRIPGSGPLEAAGIPAPAYSGTSETAPGDLEALRARLTVNAENGGTAAVLLEPVGPESGTHPAPHDFNAAVRELCDEFGTLLVFDEVVTGFRLGMGGAQGYYGVAPDLTVFGKCVAGGYPAAGGVGGREEVMAAFAGGLTAAGQRALTGGTLAANPLSCTAGYHTLLEMDRLDAPAKAGAAGDRLRAGLEGLIAKYELPYVTYNFGSIVHLHTSGVLHLRLDDPEFFDKLTPRLKMLGHMSLAYAAEGVITLAGSRIYTSMADTDEVIDDALAAFERVFAQIPA